MTEPIKYLKEIGIDIKRLSEESELSQPTIYSMVKGERPTRKAFEKISRALMTLGATISQRSKFYQMIGVQS